MKIDIDELDSVERVEQILTVPEAAQILRVSPATVYELIRQHKLTAIRVGRLLRITRPALGDFLSDPNGGPELSRQTSRSEG